MADMLPKRKSKTTDPVESSAEYLEITQRLDAVEFDVQELSETIEEIKEKQEN